MKKVLLFLSISLLSAIVYAQNQKVSINWGPSIKSKYYGGTIYVLGKKGENTYVFESAVMLIKEHVFYVLDKNMETIKTVPFKFKSDIGDNHEIENVVLINNEIIIYFSAFDNNTKKYILAEKRFNLESIEQKGIDKIIFETPSGNSYGSFYTFKKLSDSTRTVIFGGSTTSNTLGVAVYDTKNNELLNRTVSLTLDAEYITVGDIEVDKNGTIYIGVKSSFFNSDVKNNGGNSTVFQIHSFEKNSNIDKRIRLDEEGNFLNNAFLFIQDQKLLCLGVYMDINSRISMKGYSFTRIDINSKKIELNRFNMFDFAKLSQMRKPNYIYEDEGFTIQYLQSKNIFIHSNGDISFIIEQLHEDYRNNILIVNIDEYGKENWIHYIERSARTISLDLFATKINDELFFLMYQNKKFEESSFTLGSGSIKNHVLVIYKIDSNGKLSYTLDNAVKTNPKAFISRNFFKISSKEFLVAGYDDRSVRCFGSLIINP